MMKYPSLFVMSTFCLLLFGQCKTDSSKLKQLDEDKFIELAMTDKFPDPEELIIRDVNGNIISTDSLVSMQSTRNYFVDFLVDDNNNIKSGVIRPITDADKKLIERLNTKMNEGPPLSEVQVDCSKLDSILAEVERLDQAVRSGAEVSEGMYNVDQRNLEIVMSIHANCGMPTSAKQVYSMWLVIQHASAKYRKLLLPDFKTSAANGLLKKSSIALMEDRVLMDDGQPQIYGSQVTKQGGSDWELHDLIDPETVDRRRAEIGLGPLKEYLERFDVEFNVVQK